MTTGYLDFANPVSTKRFANGYAAKDFLNNASDADKAGLSLEDIQSLSDQLDIPVGDLQKEFGLGSGEGFDGYGALKGFGAAAQGIGALYGAYTGAQQVKLGKEQLAFQKGAFDVNLANQAKTTNLQLADSKARQLGYTQDRAQVESAAGQADIRSFVDENKIRGTI